MAEDQTESQAEPQKERVFPDDYYQYDKEGAKKIILSMPEHIREGYRLAEGIRPEKSFSNVYIAGMGGSGIAADLMSYEAIWESRVPIYAVKDYDVPKTVTEDSLFIAVSYSGNTEETLSAYKMASRTGAQCLLISSGGKMQELAKLHKHQHIKLPVGIQPRMAVAYLFFPILKVLENAGVIKHHEAEVKELIESLRRQGDNGAIELSEKLFEKTPIIYASAHFYPVAYRWKTQFNENAKTPAFCHALSELCHNELLSWSNRNSQFHVVMLTTDKYHRRNLKRADLVKTILQKKGVAVTEIAVKGTPLKQMFSAILMGDMTSYYLALRYETDPTPVVLIEQFKKDLGPFLI